ncbi:signal peptidase I [Candidatus Pacearchaeota archaeon CG1_02_31_27]|nr:MAG: signal peptidase I [Candidatus Pacearchaeota archaeon CG1_02_31_27]PIN92613.1 MAG: signal peptidase I [Candidatus Pacearchaeota archaeon CG10_big_fil_rev_8_21_14_0_10_31_59]PIZ81203.1 MAG: signal peptidase I [Candidatus Pacearchaeota archaeon CG_4_10_14_0_2_um_filter_31_10]
MEQINEKEKKHKIKCTYQDHKTASGKLWHFLAHDNSIWSWIVDIILIFLIVKFLIFPGFSLIFGTPLPFVIVESSSMHHEGLVDEYWKSYGDWYEDKNITLNEFKEWKFSNGMNKGDVIVVVGKKQYQEGDVIIFSNLQTKTPIIHRIVLINEDGTYQTKGDHNNGQNNYEFSIKQSQIKGKSVLRVPYIGYPKVLLCENMKIPGICK